MLNAKKGHLVMRNAALFPVLLAALSGSACAGSANEPAASTAATTSAPDLDVRPNGDTEIQPDLSMVGSEELKQIYAHIDEHIGEHVVNLQRWIQQPSISNSGEGIPESAEMVKGFWEQLGCQQVQVYDVGTTEWGAQGNPVVYAKCDEGAPRTLLIYWMYDTMPVTQPDVWIAPPFEGRLVEQPPFKKVMIGRGTNNSKGGQMAMWNALMSIKAVAGKLPVNLIVVAEGDEERMSIGLRQFVMDHPELFQGAEAMWRGGGQSYSGRSGISPGNSEGCVYIEITTSGAAWGRGPTVSDIHGGNKRSVDSPAWRHIRMLASLISEDGNTAAVEGFYDDAIPFTEAQMESFREQAEFIDLEVAARNLGVARFMADNPVDYLRDRNWISFNLDGIWGGNMYAGGAGAILPNTITSKHNIRYVPNMTGPVLVEKIRRQLVENGYPDVEVTIIGDVPWRQAPLSGDLPLAQARTLDIFQVPYNRPRELEQMTAPYWPAYLFTTDDVSIPISSGGVGYGGNSHASNEFIVIEGAGLVYGYAGEEKALATDLYNFAGLN